LEAFGKSLRKAIPFFYEFSYEEGRKELALPEGASPEVKDVVKEYLEMVELEQVFFDRCRARLLDEIKRDGRSHVQVFSGSKKGQPGLDIVDFSHQGLIFSATEKAVAAQTVRKWASIDPLQPYVLLQEYMDKGSSGEWLALAVMAFHRAMRAEIAESPQGLEVPSDKHLRSAKAMLAQMEEAFQATLQAEKGAKTKADRFRAALRMAEELIQNQAPKK
jgi:hypothetical protein